MCRVVAQAWVGATTTVPAPRMAAASTRMTRLATAARIGNPPPSMHRNISLHGRGPSDLTPGAGRHDVEEDQPLGAGPQHRRHLRAGRCHVRPRLAELGTEED